MNLAHLLEIVKKDAWVGVAIAIGSFAVSLGLTIAVVIRIPADYFVAEHVPLPFAGHSLPVRVAARAGLNLLGLLLVVLGVVLSLPGVPGQGLLTILFGVMLLDIPGKRSIERRIIRRPAILKSVNRLRARYGRPPVQVEEPAQKVQDPTDEVDR